jgi:hypothetical protein
MKLAVIGAEKVGNLYNIKDAMVMKFDSEKRAGLAARGFRLVTPKGYKSNKPVLVELEVIGEQVENVYCHNTSKMVDVVYPVINQEQLDEICAKYLQPITKVWLGTPEQQAASRAAAGWASVARATYMNDFESTQGENRY